MKQTQLPAASIAPSSSIEHQWQYLTQAPALHFSAPQAHRPDQTDVRLIRLDEINEECHQTYRQALANVYAALDNTQSVRLLYLLDGGPGGVNLYFGVVADSSDIDLHQAMQNLRGALEGHLPGINFGDEISYAQKTNLLQRLSSSKRRAAGHPYRTGTIAPQ